MQTTSEDFAQLRGAGRGPNGSGGIDGSDNFMTGHRICGPRRPERKKSPDWALSFETLGVLIKKMFPEARRLFEGDFGRPGTKRAQRRMRTTGKQAGRASMYFWILYRYFLEHQTASWIAGDLVDDVGREINDRGITAQRVEHIIQECRYAAAGLRRNGMPKTNGKRGRKPKIDARNPESN